MLKPLPSTFGLASTFGNLRGECRLTRDGLRPHFAVGQPLGPKTLICTVDEPRKLVMF